MIWWLMMNRVVAMSRTDLIGDDLSSFFDSDDFAEAAVLRMGGQECPASVIVREGVEQYSPDGLVEGMGIEVQLAVPAFPLGAGGLVEAQSGNYRIVRPVSNDGVLATYLVVSADNKGW